MRAVLATAVLVLGLGVFFVAAPLAKRHIAPGSSGAEMTELKVRDVVPLSSLHQAAIILTPEKGDLIVPVLITEDEGEALSDQLHGHGDGGGLLKKAIAGFGGKLVRVELNAVRGETVVAQVIVDREGKSVTFEGSPADSISLAVQEHVPLLAAPAVMKELGLTRDQIRSLAKGSQHAPGSGNSAGQHELTPSSDGNTISL